MAEVAARRVGGREQRGAAKVEEATEERDPEEASEARRTRM